MKVTNELAILELNGERQPCLDAPKLWVESHAFHNGLLVLVTPQGQRLTLAAKELDAAIRNAANVPR